MKRVARGKASYAWIYQLPIAGGWVGFRGAQRWQWTEYVIGPSSQAIGRVAENVEDGASVNLGLNM
jgi:hypothetical protein